ncbi:MAG: DUF305 domain-containing protein [Altererythrobacter sp.]|nr:DUF305 domain-containing protein [Altererythrobacter sp.]
MEDHAKSAHHEGGSKPYMMLAVNLGLSLLVMYVAMFAMIWSWGEFIQNVNFFYMALVMWAPMGAIMLATMGGMYRNRKLNAALYVAFAAILVLSLVGIRQQSLVGDDQFLRSMIPHHSGAILMCEEAKLTDPEIRRLCGEIIQAQRDEIAEMKRIMDRL